MNRITYLLLITLLVISACSSNKLSLSTEEKLKKADDYYARGKYARAAMLYDEISFERKSAATAYANLRVADSYFAINKFSDARAKYEQFISSFPDHDSVANAYFRIGECLYEESLPAQYDQTETINSIDAFRLFMEKYPGDERYSKALDYIRKAQYKLLEKTYQNGYIHYKMKDYSAALMYFDELIALGNTDKLDRQALYYSAKLHLHQKNLEKAQASFTSLQNRYPGSKETQRLAAKFK